jgi:4-diphosphocytidyl-2C-methyl-D-erythritol kinase
MSNLKSLKTNHYKTKILNTKKLKLKNNIYIGFNINDLQNIKLKDKLEIENVLEFNLKGLSFINKKYIQNSTLNNI